MACAICNRTDEDGSLVRAIWDGEILDVCRACVIKEGIPVIKKATPEQVEAANVHYTVRERMERLSNRKPILTKDQSITSRNLSKLHFPNPRQDHESLIENYDWTLRTTRRRQKISPIQLSEKSGVSEADINSLESGQLIQNLEQNVAKIEIALGVQLFKHHATSVYFRQQPKTKEQMEKEILENIEGKIDAKPEKEKRGLFKKISSGKFDFSKKENIENITLKDLAELKKQKEKNEMFGEDDLELEEEL
jgi:ribosome-binding protein aMBF1 (putative translation factor)